MTCQCSYGTCNKCLMSRSLQSGLIFFAVSSPPVQAMLQGSIFKSTLLFMFLAFLLMKLKSKRSFYTLRDPLDMSHPASRSSGIVGRLNAADL